MISTRPAIADDRAFIVSGWSTTYGASRDLAIIPMDEYAAVYRPYYERLVDRAAVLVAHGETGLLFGFVAYDPTTYVAVIGGRRVTLDGHVLYLYVASPFRRRGIAHRLLAAAGINPSQRFGYACRTRWSWELRSKIPLAEYDPYRARYEEIEHGRDIDRRTEAAGQREAGGLDPEGAGADPPHQALAVGIDRPAGR